MNATSNPQPNVGRVPVSDLGRARDTHNRIGHATIARVVDDFYERVQRHPTLAEPFRVVSDWHEHKARLTHFWWVALGGEAYAPYHYEVGRKHADVGVTSALVDDWLALFETTMHEHVAPDVAQSWLHRARRMGDSLRLLGEFYRRKAARPPE